MPDTSDNWYLIDPHGRGSTLGPCGAVIRDAETGELVRGCIFWTQLTLIEGRWLCRRHAAGDLSGLVFPALKVRQAALW